MRKARSGLGVGGCEGGGEGLCKERITPTRNAAVPAIDRETIPNLKTLSVNFVEMEMCERQTRYFVEMLMCERQTRYFVEMEMCERQTRYFVEMEMCERQTRQWMCRLR